MKRIILFSKPSEENRGELLDLIFQKTIKKKVFAYLPTDGANCPEKFLKEWQGYAEKYGTQFHYIDNSKKESLEEKKKLINSNILFITGGNTFTLLYNLRLSGLDKTIKEFSQKKEFVISGGSAGAIVLTPSIKIASLSSGDPNKVGIKNLDALNLLDFEIFPHYSKKNKLELEKYKEICKNKIKVIPNGQYLVIEK